MTGLSVNKAEVMAVWCADDFARLRGPDRLQIVPIDDDPVWQPLREWLAANPLYPYVIVVDFGIVHEASGDFEYKTETFIRPEPGTELFRIVLDQFTREFQSARILVFPNDGRPRVPGEIEPSDGQHRLAGIRLAGIDGRKVN